MGTELPTLVEPVIVRIVSQEEPDHPHSHAHQGPLGLWLLPKEPDYPSLLSQGVLREASATAPFEKEVTNERIRREIEGERPSPRWPI